MSIPINKIEIYSNGDLLHAITNGALNIHVKDTATDNVGIFSFILPTKFDGDNYYYNDVAVYDKVKLFFGYQDAGGLPANPDFVGRIYQISAPLSIESGYVRVFTGKLLGQILKRRIKHQKQWINTAASTIVTELATELVISTTEIEVDNTEVNLTVDAETYWDVLCKVSDYWKSADEKIQKDFWVSWDNKLYWKTRPLRETPNVEVLTVGENIINYNVLRDIESMKNRIRVYGKAERPWSGVESTDAWTESTTDWTTDGSSVDTDTDPKYVGSYSVKATKANSATCYLQRTGLGGVDCTGRFRTSFNKLKFACYLDDPGSIASIVDYWLYIITSSGNYYQKRFVLNGEYGKWHVLEHGLNDGTWQKVGSPDWSNITAVRVIFQYSGNMNYTFYQHIDMLHFWGARYQSSVVEDADSQILYGVAELVHIDDMLLSDSDCNKRANALLTQLKNLVIRLDVVIPGCTNVKLGDRILMTIPAENITAKPYDVVSAEHSFSNRGFLTSASMINTADTRTAPSLSINEALRREFQLQKIIARGLQIIK